MFSSSFCSVFRVCCSTYTVHTRAHTTRIQHNEKERKRDALHRSLSSLASPHTIQCTHAWFFSWKSKKNMYLGLWKSKPFLVWFFSSLCHVVSLKSVARLLFIFERFFFRALSLTFWERSFKLLLRSSLNKRWNILLMHSVWPLWKKKNEQRPLIQNFSVFWMWYWARNILPRYWERKNENYDEKQF